MCGTHSVLARVTPSRAGGGELAGFRTQLPVSYVRAPSCTDEVTVNLAPGTSDAHTSLLTRDLLVSNPCTTPQYPYPLPSRGEHMSSQSVFTAIVPAAFC